MKAFARALEKTLDRGEDFVVVTLTDIRGSAPQERGAKMIVSRSGLEWGTVGGGKIENHCIEFARGLIADGGESGSRTWNLQTEIGMSCGGEVTLFFEVERSASWSIAVFGAGHISQQLCRVMAAWSARVQVFDTRPEWVERFAPQDNLTARCVEDLPGQVEKLPPGTSVLCMTQGHGTDLPILDRVLGRVGEFPFVGVIGSDVKGMKIRRELKERGHGVEDISRIHCPLGLPLGNSTPGEIAISIAAQLLAVRDRKTFSVRDGEPENGPPPVL